MAKVVGRLSHDFSNVLTGILGFTELGLEQLAPESPAFRRIREVYEAAQQGVHLINRLNLFSPRTARHPYPTFLAPVAAEEISRLRAAWGPAVTLAVAVPADLPPVALERASLRHILAALLDNARQAVAAGGEVTLAAARTEVTISDCLDLLGNPTLGPAIHLTVADTGSGFSLEARRRVFAEPFFSTKPRHRGTGLISIYGLLRASGGGFRLEHGDKGGTKVHVYLPLAEQEASVPAARMAAKANPRPYQVLVVDDDATTCRLTQTMLECAGFEVHTAADGAEARAASRNAARPFDLVLVAAILPGMDGFELAQQLVKEDPQVNILFLSGHLPAGCGQDVLRGSGFALLNKPFQPAALLRAVRDVLKRSAV